MSDQLVPSAGPSFQQSGQLDWVSLSRSLVHISVGTLARLSRAGVDAYTVQVGKALCWNFQLSAKVQDNLMEEIKNLKCAKLCDNLLWFGFGIKQVVADLVETEQGLALVALCSALTTNYDVFYAAQVLRELCLLAEAPQNFRPSLQQWKALVRLCSGILMDSPFQLLLNGLQRLVRGPKPIFGQQAIKPASLAKGLSNLALLSKGLTVRLSFSGGEDCCWLAAFAKWVLSLDVAIYDAMGSLMYLSQDQMSETPQVIFNLDIKASNTVLSAQKTSLVPRGQSLIKLEAREFSASGLSSFSTWATILHDTFGSVVDILLAGPCSDDFAVFLCDRPALDWLIKNLSEPRIRATDNEPPSPPDSGRMESLMHSAINLLPELSLLKTETCWHKRKDHGALDKSLHNIKKHCCMNNADTSSRQTPGYFCDANPCLVGLAHTICVYLRVLLKLNIGDHVAPSSLGLSRLYQNRGWPTYEPDHDIFVQRVHQALTGDSTQIGNKRLSARAGNGLCVFTCFLEDPMGPVHETWRFGVLRGYIAYEDGCYESLSDMHTILPPSTYNQDDQFRVVTKSRAITAQAVVEETDDERNLSLGYKVRCSQLESKNMWLMLGDLVSVLWKAHSAPLVSCPRRHKIRYQADDHVRSAVEKGLSRWVREYGYVLFHFVPSPSAAEIDGTASLYFGEGPALYTTYKYCRGTHDVGIVRCLGCLECLLDWMCFGTGNFELGLKGKGKTQLYGLKEMPITVEWERELAPSQSSSPPSDRETPSSEPSDGSISSL